MTENNIQTIRNAYQALKAAHDALLDLCKKQFPPKSIIFWRNRGHLQTGIVENVYASNPHHGVYIYARNFKTNKMIHVRFSEVDWAVLQDHLSSVEE